MSEITISRCGVVVERFEVPSDMTVGRLWLEVRRRAFNHLDKAEQFAFTKTVAGNDSPWLFLASKGIKTNVYPTPTR